MNWYKQIKLAVPITEAPGKMTYFDVGHNVNFSARKYNNTNINEYPEEEQKIIRDFEHKEALWYILKDFNFLLVPAMEIADNGFIMINTHRDSINGKDVLAQGRYDKNKNVVSFVGYFPSSDNPKRQEYSKKRIYRILDHIFKNAPIYGF
jgi:hypothetical protein